MASRIARVSDALLRGEFDRHTTKIPPKEAYKLALLLLESHLCVSDS